MAAAAYRFEQLYPAKIYPGGAGNFNSITYGYITPGTKPDPFIIPDTTIIKTLPKDRHLTVGAANAIHITTFIKHDERPIHDIHTTFQHGLTAASSVGSVLFKDGTGVHHFIAFGDYDLLFKRLAESKHEMTARLTKELDRTIKNYRQPL